MAPDALIIDYDPFAMESRVSLMKDGRQEYCRKVPSTIPELTENILHLTDEHQVYEVRVRAPSAITYEIKRQVAEVEMRTYSENKITIEGM